MAVYPPRGTPLWDDPLRAYIDGVIVGLNSVYVRKDDPPYNVQSYGAAGNGATNDAAAIQSAIDAAASAGGGTVLFPEGVYKINSPLVVSTSNIRLVGESGAAIDGSGIVASTTLSDKFAIDASGSLAAPVALTANLAKDASVVTVGSTATFVAGDMVRITSSQDYVDGTGADYGNRGALHRIKSVDSATQLTLTTPSFFAYTTAAGASIAKVNALRGFVVDSLKITMGGTGKSHSGVQVSYADSPLVRLIDISGCEDTGIEFRTVWGGWVEKCRVRNAVSGSLGNTGYGVCVLEASRDTQILSSNFDNCRHAVAGGGVIVSILVKVRGNLATNCIDASFDCHEESWWWEFEGNTVIGGAGDGILIRGQAATVRNNVIRNTGANGIHVRSYDISTTPLAGPQVTDNDVENTNGVNIQWEGTADCRIAGGRIAGNRLVRGKFGNINVWLSDDLTIENNECDTTHTSGGSDGNNIRIIGSSLTSRCQRIVIRGCTFRNAENRWIKADFTNGLTIENCYVVNNVNTAHLASIVDAKVRDITGPAAPGVSSTVNTDASLTLTPMISAETLLHTGTLTANRTITLSTTNAYVGARFRVVRTGGGAFTLSVGGLKSLGIGSWAEVMYDGSLWVLVAYGTL